MGCKSTALKASGYSIKNVWQSLIDAKRITFSTSMNVSDDLTKTLM